VPAVSECLTEREPDATETRMNPPKLRFLANLAATAVLATIGCNGTPPSMRVQSRVALPVPRGGSPVEERSSTRPTATPAAAPISGNYRISALSLIRLTFNRHPEIQSSYQKFKSEEARYDFFFASNDSLTPRFRTTNEFHDSRRFDRGLDSRVGERGSDHIVEVGVEKQFFDTTRMDVAMGVDTSIDGPDSGYQPFMAANIRYPLWASREKLERASEDIFRQNELNDSQLEYIEEVRDRLEEAMRRFYRVLEVRQLRDAAASWVADLEALQPIVTDIPGPRGEAARGRFVADLSRAQAEFQEQDGRIKVVIARLKSSTGLPYDINLEIDGAPFNPFMDQTHKALLDAAIETDPEIATLGNSLKNAEVQLDLARRGKWDIALLLAAETNLRGRGRLKGSRDWRFAAGVEISAVDSRVTGSLKRQALANISRFEGAIESRKRSIYVNTFEPLIRIESLSGSQERLREATVQLRSSYEAGVTAFSDGRLEMDDLLKRRENLFGQQEQVAELTSIIGFNIAELCTATGKFFELLDTP